MFQVFGGNGAVFGGNGPPTKSECGQLWDAYMSECCEEEFPYNLVSGRRAGGARPWSGGDAARAPPSCHEPPYRRSARAWRWRRH